MKGVGPNLQESYPVTQCNPKPKLNFVPKIIWTNGTTKDRVGSSTRCEQGSGVKSLSFLGSPVFPRPIEQKFKTNGLVRFNSTGARHRSSEGPTARNNHGDQKKKHHV